MQSDQGSVLRASYPRGSTDCHWDFPRSRCCRYSAWAIFRCHWRGSHSSRWNCD